MAADYRSILTAAHQRFQADDPPAPLSFLDHKNAKALDAWRHRLSAQSHINCTRLNPFPVRAAVALLTILRGVMRWFRGVKPSMAPMNGEFRSVTHP